MLNEKYSKYAGGNIICHYYYRHDVHVPCIKNVLVVQCNIRCSRDTLISIFLPSFDNADSRIMVIK
jgi:hypothetical protein